MERRTRFRRTFTYGALVKLDLADSGLFTLNFRRLSRTRLRRTFT